MEKLIRFVLSPEQVVTPDLRCKLPGRGLWLSASREVIEQAVKKNLFARGFRTKIIVKDNLADTIYELTRNDAIASLSLANKAGLVITGYEKIKRALAKGDVKYLLHASGAANNGTQKLDRFFLQPLEPPEQSPDHEQIPPLLKDLFTGDELSLALGRPNVIHIGLKRGKLARRFAFAVQKTAAFQPANEGTALANDNHQ